MSTHKYFDRICIVVLIATIVATVLFMNGKNLGLASVIDEDAETYEGDVNFTKNDYNGTWEKEDACTITLDGDSAKVKGNGAYFYGNRLVIAGGGYYEVSGELNAGQIVVDAYDSSKVFIKLDGASVYCPDDAAIRVDQADKVFLTLAAGTENSLSSGETYSDDALSDGSGGVIFSHDDLTINGSGSLDITASYKHGIDANDDLVITGGKISVTAPEDAIHVNDDFKFTGADLTINAGDDAIHADENILVAGGSILINECYEGLEALTIDVQDGNIEVYPSDDGFNANGSSQSSFGGFGGGPGKASDTDATEDDASEEDSDEDTWVHISGGTVTIINRSGMDADGIDSNGDIVISGGVVRVSLNGGGTNNAIDYGSESGGVFRVDGGTVVACGGSTMMEAASDSSTQCTVLYNFDETTQDNTYVSLADEAGNELAGWEVPCGFNSLTFSCPGIKQGKTYNIRLGEETAEITFDLTSVSLGNSEGGFGGFGGFGGGFGGFGGGRHNKEDSESGDDESESLSDRSGDSDFTPPEMPTDGEGFTPPEMPADGGDFTPPEMPDGEDFTLPDMPKDGGDFSPPGFGQGGDFTGPGQETEQEEAVDVSKGTPVTELSSDVWIWVGVSVASLILALVLIVLYRRRR